MSSNINILLILKNKLFHNGIKRMLELVPEFRVIADDEDAEKAERLAEYNYPNIVLLDIIIPNINFDQYIENIIATYPESKVILLTEEKNEIYLDYVLENGIHDYLLINADEKTLVKAVKAVSNGDFYLDPQVTHYFLNKYRKAKLLSTTYMLNKNTVNYKKPLHILTKRECDILQLLAEGKTNRMIAETISLSEKTVNNHVSSILKKMNVKDRTNAVISAFREGWIII